MRILWLGLSVVITSFMMCSLVWAEDGTCPEPPAGRVTDVWLEEYFGTPNKPVAEATCCCYTNYLGPEYEHPGGSTPDYCCNNAAPGYVTRWTIKTRDVLPMVTTGSWLVDEDNDGVWDGYYQAIQWDKGECRYNGDVVRLCWPGWRELDSVKLYYCELCD